MNQSIKVLITVFAMTLSALIFADTKTPSFANLSKPEPAILKQQLSHIQYQVTTVSSN